MVPLLLGDQSYHQQFQQPPGLLVQCCGVPPTEIGVDEVLLEDQGL